MLGKEIHKISQGMRQLYALPCYPGRRCFVLHVPVSLKHPGQHLNRSVKLFRGNTRGWSGSFIIWWYVCSCKISILIRKTATAVRIAGWNRRRIIIETLLLLHFRGSFVAPLLLCVPDDRVSTFRTQWSGSNCGYYDDTATHCPQSFLRFMQSLRYIQILWSKSFLKPWRFYI